MKPKIPIILLFIIFFCTQLRAQEADWMINGCNKQVVKDNILLNWEIVSGSTCNGIDILRSSDNIHFIVIGHISGICGNTTHAAPYQWTDKEPIENADNYYKLKLGSNGNTSSFKIHYIDLGKSGYIVTPNPVFTTAKITFNNPDNSSAIINVMDLTGNVVWVSEKTIGNEIVFDRTQLTSGYYFFTVIYNDDVHYSGRIVVE